MTTFAVPPPPRGRPAARVWLPLTLSLGLHALIGLAVVLIPSGEGAHAGGPLPADTVILDPDDGLIILEGPSSPKKSRPRADAEESEPAFPATVDDLPVVAAPPMASAGPAPKAGASEPTPTGGGGRGEVGGSATGLLRAPKTARNVVYVIDRSLSMGMSGALPIAKRELLAGIDGLPADSHFAVILYNRQAEPLTLDGRTGLLPATQANRAAVVRLVEGARAEGGTDHVTALRRAVAMGADVIFFVTDADEMTAEQVRNVALLNRGRAVIHTVEINNDPATREEAPLKLLARLCGGTHRALAIPR